MAVNSEGLSERTLGTAGDALLAKRSVETVAACQAHIPMKAVNALSFI